MGAPHTVATAAGPWEHRSISANGALFHVVDASPGATDRPLVLLLHGFPQNWYAFRHQLPALADAGYHAVAMDLRGFGGSDKPPRGYSPTVLATDVHALIRSLGHRRAALVGAGVGGIIAFSVARIVPTAVTSLALLGTPPPTSPWRALTPERVTELIGLQVPVLPTRRLRSGDLVGTLLADWGGEPRRAAPSWLDARDLELYRHAMRLPHVAEQSLKYMHWPLRVAYAARVRPRRGDAARPVAPLLQVHGSRDRLVPAASLRAVRTAAGSRGRLEVLAGAGHFVAEQAPAAVTALLLETLAQQQPAA